MMKSEKPSAEKKKEWLENPKYWRFSDSVYFNPEDKRILPPKKHQYMGWTINFGNPFSVLALVLFVGLVIYFCCLITE